jgi:hypothetical protein
MLQLALKLPKKSLASRKYAYLIGMFMLVKELHKSFGRIHLFFISRFTDLIWVSFIQDRLASMRELGKVLVEALIYSSPLMSKATKKK